jgi:hypothetical protein
LRPTNACGQASTVGSHLGAAIAIPGYTGFVGFVGFVRRTALVLALMPHLDVLGKACS